MRVLLVSRDRRFVGALGFALQERCVSASATHHATALERVREFHAAIVVVDGTESIAAAGRLVAALRALHPTVHVLVVHEHPRRVDFAAFPLFAKWDEPEELARRILGCVDTVGAVAPAAS